MAEQSDEGDSAGTRIAVRNKPLTERQQLELITRLEESSSLFRIIGGLSIVLSLFYVLAVTLGSLNGLTSIYLLWACLSFVFSFTNGMLVLRAANNNLPLDLGWKEMTFGYGLACFAFHSVGLVFAMVRLANAELSSSGKFAEVCYTALLVVFALLELMQAIQGCEVRQLISAVRDLPPQAALPSQPLAPESAAPTLHKPPDAEQTSLPPSYEEAVMGLV